MNGTLGQRLETLSPQKRALLEKRLGKTFSPKTNPCLITRRADANAAPLSFSQEGLLFMEQLDPGTSRYNVVDAIRVRGRFELDLVQQALDKMVERHEALRTVFAEADGVWQQMIVPPARAHVNTIDLGLLPVEDREASAIDIVQKESDRPMDLTAGPLFTATLVRVDELDTVMLIKMHHILSDGWSLGVFWNEFTALYSGLIQGEAPDLPELPVQFGDYACWSREYLQAQIDKQTKYWTEKLSGAPALLEMPTDRPRPAVQTSNGAQEVVHFSADLLDGITGLCKAEGSTLYMTLLAGFNALLARYTGARDLVVGTPTAGRNRTETEHLIGYFVNTLVLRSDLSGDPTFREILRQARSTVLDAFSHQELPFEKVVAALRPERSLSFNPVYQVMFALQDAATSKLEIPGATVDPLKLKLSTSKFDLFLSARQGSRGFEVTVEYNKDLFDQSTIQRFIGHYRNLLASAVKEPGVRLSELSILDDEERHQLLVEWNDTKTSYPERAVHDLFNARASKTLESVAMVAGDHQWTYAELSDWSDRMANYFRAKGVGQDQRIGIFMDRSPVMIAAILGVLKCGASYVPIDPANPSSRLDQIIEDSGLFLMLTGSAHAGSLSGIGIHTVDLDAEGETILQHSNHAISHDRGPDDVACVLYTSGSTGRPKGVLIPHRAIVRLVINTNYVQLSESDRVAHVSNVAFDLALFEIWGALLNGGRLVILPREVVLSPEDFAAQLRSSGVTAMILATSLFHLMSREKPQAFGTMDTLLVAGEAFDPAAGRAVLKSGPPKRMINAYGPTESTTFATWKLLDEIPDDAQSVPIGRPLSNTTAFLLDETCAPVPVGVVGEVYLGGDGLATGYLDRPELTAERFVQVPGDKVSIADLGAVRLYRTGDLARYLPNGDLEYTGRRDHQVKIRGYRIELGEVESVIEAHPEIAESVVLDVRDANDHRMVAFFSTRPDSDLDEETLTDYLREKLPNYMVPGSLVHVDKFELNGNGKIDRRQLEKMASTIRVERHGAVDHAADELELRLTWIWQKILGIGVVGATDNFFDLGGHSLAAVRVFSEIERTLGCRLPLATLFSAPTIRDLAEVIRKGGWKSKWHSLVPVQTNGTKPPFFCVHAVGGNILEYKELIDRLSPDQPYYGLQSVGLDGRSAPLTDIGAMAAAYIKDIRDVQPHGPYHLGGRSFGGTVAYEMARQLRSEGEEIAMLAIFDSYPKGWRQLFPPEVAKAYSRNFRKLRFQRHLKNWMQLGTIGKIRYAATKIGYKSRKLKSLAWRIVESVRPTVDSVDSLIRNIEEINYSAHRGYVPQVYEGKVTFFCAKEEICPEENLTGWRRLALGGVDVVEVPGDHQTMIKEPHVATLAEKLETAIANQEVGVVRESV